MLLHRVSPLKYSRKKIDKKKKVSNNIIAPKWGGGLKTNLSKKTVIFEEPGRFSTSETVLNR